LLRTRCGVVRLVSSSKVPGRHSVLNIQVEGAHNFYVSRSEILSHNTDNRLCEDLSNAAQAGFSTGPGSILRKINFRPSTPGWGLTRSHIDKHLFGNGPMSLKTIDSAGTADKWMHHLSELYNAASTSTTSNGKLDIIRLFQKADGTGWFKLGIRLSPNADGTFDLITILTKQ
jgi:hypothetical protein